MSVPDIEELEEMVYLLNCEIYEKIGTEYITCSLHSDGFCQSIELFGIPIWDSESDDRLYISEESDIKEEMEVHLRRIMSEELQKLSKINL